jgi:LmbE family N-acetylglucosaminyl deacetylase
LRRHDPALRPCPGPAARAREGLDGVVVATRLERLLAELAGSSDPIDLPIAVVVAHPDDETIGIGGQLDRFTRATLVHLTDGAPIDMVDATRLGFANRAAYAAARRSELERALAESGTQPIASVSFGVPDREAAFRLADIAGRLADLLADRAIEIVLTHPYEGGHPDHDACAFAGWAATRLLQRRGLEPPEIAEMAFYHAAPGAHGWYTQEFLPAPDRPAIAIRLHVAQLEKKQRMMAAYRTQQGTLAAFHSPVEQLRAAPAYDFTLPPNHGRLNDATYGPMTAPEWCRLAGDALRALGLERGP